MNLELLFWESSLLSITPATLRTYNENGVAEWPVLMPIRIIVSIPLEEGKKVSADRQLKLIIRKERALVTRGPTIQPYRKTLVTSTAVMEITLGLREP